MSNQEIVDKIEALITSEIQRLSIDDARDVLETVADGIEAHINAIDNDDDDEEYDNIDMDDDDDDNDLDVDPD
jgi:hypothetical protein